MSILSTVIFNQQKWIDKDKKLCSKRKSVNLRCRDGENTMHGSKHSTKELLSWYKLDLQANSWFCNFIFSQLLIPSVFEKQRGKKPFTSSRKVLEKMPGQH